MSYEDISPTDFPKWLTALVLHVPHPHTHLRYSRLPAYTPDSGSKTEFCQMDSEPESEPNYVGQKETKNLIFSATLG